MGRPRKITDKQRVFIREYMKDKNGVRAARVAGYKNPEGSSRDLLHQNVLVMQEIKKLAESQAKKLELTSERVLLEDMRIGFVNVLDVFNDDGTLRPVSDWGPDIGAAVQAIEIVEVAEGVKVSKVRFWDKNAALDKLMKHLGLFAADNAQKGRTAIENLPEEVRKPLLEKLSEIAGGSAGVGGNADPGTSDRITH